MVKETINSIFKWCYYNTTIPIWQKSIGIFLPIVLLLVLLWIIIIN